MSIFICSYCDYETKARLPRLKARGANRRRQICCPNCKAAVRKDA